jgi:hypothetical protein
MVDRFGADKASVGEKISSLGEPATARPFVRIQ